MQEIKDPQEVLQLFEGASKEHFWGTLTFGFQDGLLTLIRKEATIKVHGLNFLPTKIDAG